MTKPRAIIVVIEGASPSLIDPWVSSGALKGFGKLFQLGAYGELESGAVPYEVPGVVSIVTGHPPGEHGLYSFWSAHEDPARPRVLAPSDLLVQPFWRRPELAQKTFGLVNVYGTHPPEAINGWILSYAMEQTLRSSYPKGLAFELAQRGIHYAQEVSVWYEGQPRDPFLAKVLYADRQRAAAALELWERGADVVMLVLTSLDRTGHYYWQELEAGSPFAPTESAIFSAYATCDEIVGRLCQLVDDNTTLIALSEQGFGPLRAYVSVNSALAKSGWLGYANNQDETSFDWSRTRAFEAAQGTHGINLNLRGRYASGTVLPEDYESTRRDLIAELKAMINPHTGTRLFGAARPREEVYAGAGVERAPDIIVEPLDERYQPLGHPHWAQRVNRRWHSGWHRRQSFLAAAGPGIRSGRRMHAGSTLDVLPMLFRALGRDIPKDLAEPSWSGM